MNETIITELNTVILSRLALQTNLSSSTHRPAVVDKWPEPFNSCICTHLKFNPRIISLRDVLRYRPVYLKTKLETAESVCNVKSAQRIINIELKCFVLLFRKEDWFVLKSGPRLGELGEDRVNMTVLAQSRSLM